MLNYKSFSNLCYFLKVVEEKKYNINMKLEDCFIIVELISRFEDFENLKDLFNEFKESYQDRIVVYACYENILYFKYRILD